MCAGSCKVALFLCRLFPTLFCMQKKKKKFKNKAGGGACQPGNKATMGCMAFSAECPVSELDDYRLEVLVALRKLERLDKDEFTEEERADAEEVGVVVEGSVSYNPHSKSVWPLDWNHLSLTLQVLQQRQEMETEGGNT